MFSNVSNASNCSDICFEKDIKIDINSNECIKSCNDRGYNYEFGDICYNECPEGTQTLNNESILCVKIIANYGSKINIPEGYYLDINDGKLKQCFETCKYCNGFGDEINNNC